MYVLTFELNIMAMTFLNYP